MKKKGVIMNKMKKRRMMTAREKRNSTTRKRKRDTMNTCTMNKVKKGNMAMYMKRKMNM